MAVQGHAQSESRVDFEGVLRFLGVGCSGAVGALQPRAAVPLLRLRLRSSSPELTESACDL